MKCVNAWSDYILPDSISHGVMPQKTNPQTGIIYDRVVVLAR